MKSLELCLAYSRHSVSVSCCYCCCILIVVLSLRGQGHLGSAEKQVPSSARCPALLGPRARTPHPLLVSLLHFAKLSEPLSNPVASGLPKSVPNFQNSFLNSGKEMEVQASLWEERKARRPLSAPLPQSQRCTGSRRQRLLGFCCGLSLCVGVGSPGLCPPLHPGAVVGIGGPAAYGGQVLRAGQ